MEERVVISVEEENLDEARRLATVHGAELKVFRVRGEPVTLVTLVILGSVAVVAATVHAIERVRGGQVIDLRSLAERPIYRSKDVIYGYVVILADDGSASIEIHEPNELITTLVDNLFSMLTELGVHTIDAAAEVATLHVGDAGVIEQRQEEPPNHV